MKTNDIQTALLIGIPIKINDKFDFKSPIMKEIFDIGFENLIGAINTVYDLNYVLFKNQEINKIIEENNFCSYDTWQLVLALEKEMNVTTISEYLIKCLKWHFNEDIIIDDECNVLIGGKQFDKSDYEELCKVLKVAYGLEERIEERSFGDLLTRRKAIEMRISRSEIDAIENKDNSFLYQILSVLKTKKSDNEIQNSNLFQLIDLYKRINKEKDYDNLMAGVYTGNIDIKKIDINKKHWTSKLDN